MLNKRTRKTSILTIQNINAIALVCLSLTLLKTQFRVHDLEKTLTAITNSDFESSNYSCVENQNNNTVICETKNIVELNN
ncbi:DUF1496 domain-containing protein [Vibrio crassostreae]|nr:DUF1496 domain-containing protein [Vibrio crassostreae]